MRGGIACECMLIGFRGQPWAPRLGAAGEVARWSETVIGFACWYLCGIETAIAFAGEKWAFLVQFLGAVVSSVAVVPCWRRAVVLLVSTSPCFCVLCALFVAPRPPLLPGVCEKVRPARPIWVKSALFRRAGRVFSRRRRCRGRAGRAFSRRGTWWLTPSAGTLNPLMRS